MLYLIGKIITCLLIAFLFGVLIGWLLKRSRRVEERIEAKPADAPSAATEEVRELRKRLEECNSSLQARALRINELENESRRLRSQLQSAKMSAPLPPPAEQKDDLKEIRGIGKVLEARLNRMGIYTFRQIAEWNDAEVDRISENIGPFRNRIRDDNWVEQAGAKHRLKYGGKS